MKKKDNKTQMAKELGVSRGMLYYTHKRDVSDEVIKKLILDVLDKHKAYGHKRIAPELGLNKKRILRVMKKFGIKPIRRRKMPVKPEDQNKQPVVFQNLIKTFCPIQPNVVWVGDFTYLNFQSKFYYLSTAMDLFTREIIGWSFSNTHNTKLVIEAFDEARNKTNKLPMYFHSDQGSEYDSHEHLTLVQNLGVLISMSKKSSPWENGFQESFYSNFKLELGDPDRFNSLGELIEAISIQFHYYNNDRIHTKLKTSPTKFRLQRTREYVFKEMGT